MECGSSDVGEEERVFSNHNTDGLRTVAFDGCQSSCGEEAKSVRLPWRQKGLHWGVCLV